MYIYRYENEKERLVLRSRSNNVAAHVQIEQDVIEQMLDLMHRHKGIGLAAPQVGVNWRFFIVEVEEGKPYVFINPEIVKTSGDVFSAEEGCLSLPGLYTQVKRYTSIIIQAEDRYRKRFTLEASGLLSRCIQHENDHLNGILHIDSIDNELEKQRIVGNYIKKANKLLKNKI